MLFCFVLVSRPDQEMPSVSFHLALPVTLLFLKNAGSNFKNIYVARLHSLWDRLLPKGDSNVAGGEDLDHPFPPCITFT